MLEKDVKRLCNLILGSPPDTTIKGEIESLAWKIGHHPSILNCESKLENPPAFSNVIGCDFCTKDKIMLRRNFISTQSWGWGDLSIKLSEAIEDEIGVFIDRGTLRMARIHDCNCMDDGMPKIDIKFCPICGAKIIAS
jgi:hypothetical protein